MRDTRRARLILGLLLAVSLVLITIDHRQREDSLFEPVRAAAASLFGAAELAGTGVARPVGDFIDTFASATDSKRQIAALRAENSRLRGELSAHSLDRQRSAELARMLGLSGLGGYRVVAAQVIARRGVPGFEDAVEIDAGAGDGVKSEMTVLNGDGLVGRVVHTGPATSTVVLLTDPASSAGARVEGSSQIGVVSGLGPVAEGRLVRFRLLDSEVALAAGRRIVSFGSQHGTPYAPGLPVGTIQRVEATPGELTRVAYARPFVDFTALDVVGVVVRAPQRDPRDAMLPPPPPAAKARAATPPSKAPSAPPSPSSRPPGSPSPSSTPRGQVGGDREPQRGVRRRPGASPRRTGASPRRTGAVPQRTRAAPQRRGGRSVHTRERAGDEASAGKHDQAGERT
jgi:rod shape-determining protein MreC